MPRTPSFSFGSRANAGSDRRTPIGYSYQDRNGNVRTQEGRRFGTLMVDDVDENNNPIKVRINSRTGLKAAQQPNAPNMSRLDAHRAEVSNKESTFNQFFKNSPIARMRAAAEQRGEQAVVAQAAVNQKGGAFDPVQRMQEQLRLKPKHPMATAAPAPARPAPGRVTQAVPRPQVSRPAPVAWQTEALTGPYGRGTRSDTRTGPSRIGGLTADDWFLKHGDRASQTRRFGGRFS